MPCCQRHSPSSSVHIPGYQHICLRHPQWITPAGVPQLDLIAIAIAIAIATPASWRVRQDCHRHVQTPEKNRLLATGMLWAAAAILHPGPERNHYLARRAKGDLHMPALRNLFNRMLGQHTTA
jgi:hypothetical protein